MRTPTAVSTAFLILWLSAATAVHADDESSANRLLVKSVQLIKQYENIPADDPAQYEAQLTILREVRENLFSIVDDYPGSSLAVQLVTEERAKTLVVAEIESEIIRLEQSIPAAILINEAYQLWLQYSALPTNDTSQYEARLALLSRIATNLGTLEKQYPLSDVGADFWIDGQMIDANTVQNHILYVKSIPLLMAQSMPANEAIALASKRQLMSAVARCRGNVSTLERASRDGLLSITVGISMSPASGLFDVRLIEAEGPSEAASGRVPQIARELVISCLNLGDFPSEGIEQGSEIEIVIDFSNGQIR